MKKRYLSKEKGYFCLRCNKAHRYSSKIGEEHKDKQGLGTLY